MTLGIFVVNSAIINSCYAQLKSLNCTLLGKFDLKVTQGRQGEIQSTLDPKFCYIF
jgi:hypothetical protein